MSSLGGSNGKVPVVGDGSAWKNTGVIKQIRTYMCSVRQHALEAFHNPPHKTIQMLIDFGVNADQDTKLAIYIY